MPGRGRHLTFGALDLREQRPFLNRCRLLKLHTPPFFGQAQHPSNFRRTKPPSGLKGQSAGHPWTAENKALLLFGALAFFLITWPSLNVKRDSQRRGTSNIFDFPIESIQLISGLLQLAMCCLYLNMTYCLRVFLVVLLGPGMYSHTCLGHGIIISGDKHYGTRDMGYSCLVNKRAL